MPSNRGPALQLEFMGPDYETWKVVRDLTLTVPSWSRPQITIRAGYYGFNGRSIPEVLWWSFGHPFTSAYMHASVVHDALYQLPSIREELHATTRAAADNLFREIIVLDGVPAGRADRMLRGLTVGGGKYWSEGTPFRNLREPPDEIEVARDIRDALRFDADPVDAAEIDFRPDVDPRPLSKGMKHDGQLDRVLEGLPGVLRFLPDDSDALDRAVEIVERVARGAAARVVPSRWRSAS